MQVVSITDMHGTSFLGESLKSMVSNPGPWVVVVFLVVAVLVMVYICNYEVASTWSGNWKIREPKRLR